MMNKKGITPIIAIILLLLMTVLAGAATMLWIQRLQGTIASETERQITSSLQEMGIQFRIVRVLPISSTQTKLFNMTLLNEGSVTLNLSQFILEIEELQTTGWELIVYCNPSDIGQGAISCVDGCSDVETILPGSISTLQVNISKCSMGADASIQKGYTYRIILTAPRGQRAEYTFTA